MAEVKEKQQEDLFEEKEEINVEVEEETEEQPQEAASEDSSKEHEDYSDGVKKRIDRLTYKMREAERREQAAIEYAKKLKDDNEFYSECVSKSKNKYKSMYSENIFLKKWENIVKELNV